MHMRGEESASGKRELRDYLASQRVHSRHRRSRRFYLQIEDVLLFVCCVLICLLFG